MFLTPPFFAKKLTPIAEVLLSLFDGDDLSNTIGTAPAVASGTILLPNYNGKFIDVPASTMQFDGLNFIDHEDSNDYSFGTDGHEWTFFDDDSQQIADEDFHGFVPSYEFKQEVRNTTIPAGRTDLTETLANVTSLEDGHLANEYREVASVNVHRWWVDGFEPSADGIVSIIMRPHGRKWFRFESRLGNGSPYSYFKLIGVGIKGGVSTDHDLSIKRLDDGWYLVQIKISNTIVEWDNFQLQGTTNNVASINYQGAEENGHDLYLINYTPTATPAILTKESATSSTVPAVIPARASITKQLDKPLTKGRIFALLYMYNSSEDYVAGDEAEAIVGVGSHKLLFMRDGLNNRIDFSMRGSGGKQANSNDVQWGENQWLCYQALFNDEEGTAQVQVTNLATGVNYLGSQFTGWQGLSASLEVKVGASNSEQSPVFGGIKDIKITDDTKFADTSNLQGFNPVVEEVFNGSVDVPDGFMGIHAHDWPLADQNNNHSAAPTYGFGTFRTHDNSYAQWWRHNPSDGVYTWGDFDATIAALPTGTDVQFVVFGTPTWQATTTTINPYGQAGGSSPPSDMQKLYDYVYEGVSRYPEIKIVEIWNEPNFSSAGFFDGSASDMAEMARTIYQATKAARSSVEVISPGFTSNPDLITQFLNASDKNGGFGRDWVDGVAFHFYGKYSTNYLEEQRYNLYFDWVEDVRQAIVAGGLPYNTDLYDSEHGDDSTFFTSLTNEERKSCLINIAITAATLGVKNICWYSHDHASLLRPVEDVFIAEAFDEIHSLAGHTITKVVRRLNGVFEVTSHATPLDFALSIFNSNESDNSQEPTYPANIAADVLVSDGDFDQILFNAPGRIKKGERPIFNRLTDTVNSDLTLWNVFNSGDGVITNNSDKSVTIDTTATDARVFLSSTVDVKQGMNRFTFKASDIDPSTNLSSIVIAQAQAGTTATVTQFQAKLTSVNDAEFSIELDALADGTVTLRVGQGANAARSGIITFSEPSLEYLEDFTNQMPSEYRDAAVVYPRSNAKGFDWSIYENDGTSVDANGLVSRSTNTLIPKFLRWGQYGSCTLPLSVLDLTKDLEIKFDFTPAKNGTEYAADTAILGNSTGESLFYSEAGTNDFGVSDGTNKTHDVLIKGQTAEITIQLKASTNTMQIMHGGLAQDPVAWSGTIPNDGQFLHILPEFEGWIRDLSIEEIS